MTRLKFYDILKMATIIQEHKKLRLPSEKMSSKTMRCCWYIAILNPFYSGLFMKRFNYFKLMLKGNFWTEILKWNNTESIYISMLRSGYVLEQNFWGSHGPVGLESCGSELTFAGIWPEDPPYCIRSRKIDRARVNLVPPDATEHGSDIFSYFHFKKV